MTAVKGQTTYQAREMARERRRRRLARKAQQVVQAREATTRRGVVA